VLTGSASLIDLHCHLLPGIDDGATSVNESLEMARMAVADGISVIVCTPHILPGVYNNTGPAIRAAVAELQDELHRADIPLTLVTGAEVHLAPHLVEGIRSGMIPTLAESRYFLLEPPQGVVPPRFESIVFDLVSAGYVPVVTHPERLGWPEREYALIERLLRQGCWMQLTGGSLLGRFGRRARALCLRMLEDGLAHIIASDAHDPDRRPPLLSAAFHAAAELVGEDEAWHLVHTRQTGIMDNLNPEEQPQPPVPRERLARGGRVARS
jgi:protein-tyrosine phosphatase